jgi:hypothetical protein
MDDSDRVRLLRDLLETPEEIIASAREELRKRPGLRRADWQELGKLLKAESDERVRQIREGSSATE